MYPHALNGHALWGRKSPKLPDQLRAIECIGGHFEFAILFCGVTRFDMDLKDEMHVGLWLYRYWLAQV